MLPLTFRLWRNPGSGCPNALAELGLEHVNHLLQLEIIVGKHGQHLVALLDAGVQAMKSKRLLTSLLHCSTAFLDFDDIDFRNNDGNDDKNLRWRIPPGKTAGEANLR